SLACGNTVELWGFEPQTPSMRTRCATGLRYSPNERFSLANDGTSSRRTSPCRTAPNVGSVTDSTPLCVLVLVVELIPDPLGDIDDPRGLELLLRLCGLWGGLLGGALL